MTQETELPALPEPVKNGWMDCEDCDGRGAFGEPIYQGEFQPPECEPCSSCNGSGRWKVPLFTDQQCSAYGDARATAAVLAELAERQWRQWRPIETAPRDGTRVLLANAGGCWTGEWVPVAVSGYRFDEPWRTAMLNHKHIQGNARYDPPTHWMPLPPPPAKEPT